MKLGTIILLAIFALVIGVSTYVDIQDKIAIREQIENLQLKYELLKIYDDAVWSYLGLDSDTISVMVFWYTGNNDLECVSIPASLIKWAITDYKESDWDFEKIVRVYPDAGR